MNRKTESQWQTVKADAELKLECLKDILTPFEYRRQPWDKLKEIGGDLGMSLAQLPPEPAELRSEVENRRPFRLEEHSELDNAVEAQERLLQYHPYIVCDPRPLMVKLRALCDKGRIVSVLAKRQSSDTGIRQLLPHRASLHR